MNLLIDNYDSFSYNLFQYIGEMDPGIKVIRNDEMTVEEIKQLKPEHIIISPGPGRPEDAGIIVELIKSIKGEIPILGVCLGHQAICMAYGADIVHAKKLMHGKSSKISADTETVLFKGMNATRITVARYHSLAAERDSLPKELIVTAVANDGEVMAVQHAKYPVYGVQFHPESIMTPDGKRILKNFLEV